MCLLESVKKFLRECQQRYVYTRLLLPDKAGDSSARMPIKEEPQGVKKEPDYVVKTECKVEVAEPQLPSSLPSSDESQDPAAGVPDASADGARASPSQSQSSSSDAVAITDPYLG